jgi:phospholipase C
MDYKKNTSIVTLVALAAVVFTTVGSTVDIGSAHMVLAATASGHFRHFVTTTPSSFRHFVTTTPSSFRHFVTTIPSSFRHFTNTTANATITATATTTTTTPIKHIIVIFQENNSFDHYFGTYPNATNPPGEPAFTAALGTPTVNNLLIPKYLLSPNNPNLSQPHRIDRSNPVTCNPIHDYIDEQKSYNGGKLNLFVQNDGKAAGCQKTPTDNQVMDYFDGNTVTALWNYAQHFAMSDNFHGSTFGLSTPGHINLISGNTHGAECLQHIPTCFVPGKGKYIGVNVGTLLGDIDPRYDDCSMQTSPTPTLNTVKMVGKNIGDLLNNKSITWGWFSDGFKLSPPAPPLPAGKVPCDYRSYHTDSAGSPHVFDYYPDVEPFQYYYNTSNPHHLAPTAIIGGTDKTNHQYDLTDFWAAAKAGTLPAVSYIKAATYQQGHPKSSDPLAEQTFLVNTINAIQKSPQWSNTAIILTWDDSGGWYDHVMPPIVSPSDDLKYDALYGVNLCNPNPPAGYSNPPGYSQKDKCGYGPRIPLLIISPYAKTNFVDHAATDFTSVLKFIEDNWNLGRVGGGSLDVLANPLNNMFDFRAPHTAPLILNPSTGQKS